MLSVIWIVAAGVVLLMRLDESERQGEPALSRVDAPPIESEREEASPVITAPPVVPESGGIARRPVRLDDAGRVDEDIACRSCGYNLRGLGLTAVCPECSTPVARSIRGDELRFCDPAWLERVARGVVVIIAGILANVVFGLVVGAGVTILAMVGVMNFITITTISGVIGAGVSLITVVGVWLATTPDPGDTGHERVMSARRVARWCIVVNVAAAPLQMMSSQYGSGATLATPMTQPTFLLQMLMLVGMALAVIVAVGYLAGLFYLSKLALRMPHRSIAKQTRVVMWGFGSGQVASLAVGAVALLMLPALMSTAAAGGGAPPTGVMAGLVVISIGGCVFGVVVLVFGIWALVLLFRYSVALRRAAGEARAFWGDEAGAAHAG